MMLAHSTEHSTNLQYGTAIAYNLTTTPITPDNTTVLLMHLDNESWIGENDTRIYDWTGNGNNATPVNAVFNNTGKIGWAAAFDGNNDYINISNGYTNTIKGLDNHTISYWIRQDADDTTGTVHLTADSGTFEYYLQGVLAT